MSNFLKVRNGLFLGSLSADPSGASSADGMIYYNSVLKKFRKRRNGFWVNISDDSYAFLVGGGLISWNFATTSIAFSSDIFVERSGLNYSDNKIPVALSPLVLPTANHVAYIQEINVASGGSDLVVAVDLISNLPEGKVIIARRDGADVIFGVNRLSDGDSIKLYQTSTGGADTLYQQTLNNNQVAPAAISNLSLNSLNEKAAVVDYYVSRYHYSPSSTATNNSITQLSYNFNSGLDIFDTGVSSSAIQSDSKILIGGYFTKLGATTRNRFVRLNPDGSEDKAFNDNLGTGFSTSMSTVSAIAVQSDGKILVGGNFSTFNGSTKNGIVRLNYDGTLDSTFTATGANAVSKIIVQSDGKILVGGNFTTFNGVSKNNIVRLNTDGTIDSGFTGSLGGNVDNMALQSDGKIIVVGAFSNRIVRLTSSGTVDATFSVGTGFGTDYGYGLVIQSDGKVIVGGSFTSYNGTSVNRIVRLTSTGSIDGTFSVGTGLNGICYSAVLQSDNKILLGGLFTSYNGTSKNYIIRLNSDGSIDGTFSIGTGFDATIYSIVVQSDTNILVGGSFTSYNGTNRRYLVKLTSTGSVDSTNITSTYYDFLNNSGSTITVQSIKIQTDGKILIAGEFSGFKKSIYSRIVRVNSDLTLDTSFVVGTGFNSTVNCIDIQSDGKVLAGGSFSSYNGTSRVRIARLNSDGTLDTSFVVGTGFDNTVNFIKVQPDNKILVGGSFTSYNGTSVNRIVRLNLDGSIDSTFSIGTGADSNVLFIDLQSDGKVLIGGSFLTYNGFSSKYVARINSDGSWDNSLSMGTGFNGTVRCLKIQSDGKIIAGGVFTSYNGSTYNRIIRLTSTGSVDGAFSVGTGLNVAPRFMSIQSDGKIILVGDFTSYNGTSKNYIARLNSDGTLDTSFSTQMGLSGFSDVGYSVECQTDGKILVGGKFTAYNGFTCKSFIRLNSDSSRDDVVVSTTYTPVGSTVFGTVSQSDNKLILFGSFTSLLGKNFKGIARLNSDNSLDTTFLTGTGFDNNWAQTAAI